MFGIFKSYKRLFSNGAAEDFNRMAAFLTNFCTNESLSFDRPDNPSPDAPPTISVNTEWLKSFADGKYVTLDTEQTITGGKIFSDAGITLNDIGANHKYIMVRNNATAANVTMRTMIGNGNLYLDGILSSNLSPVLHFRNLTNGVGADIAQIYITTTGVLKFAAKGANDAWTGNMVQLNNANVDTTSTSTLAIASMGWVNDKFWRKPTSSTGFVFNTQGTLSHKAFGTTAGTVAEGNHTHTGYAESNHTHSTYLVKTALGTDTEIGYLKTLVSVLNSSGQVPLNKLVRSSGSASRGLVASTNDGAIYLTAESYYDALHALWNDYDTTLDSLPYLKMGTDGNGVWNGIYDGNGNLVMPMLTSVPATNKVLTVKANGNTVTPSWEDGGSAAQNPGGAVVSLAVATTATTADAGTWTAGGANGVVVREYGRTVWDGTHLYGFYRDKTYDKAGRLYAVSAETRYTIDTPTKVIWS